MNMVSIVAPPFTCNDLVGDCKELWEYPKEVPPCIHTLEVKLPVPLTVSVLLAIVVPIPTPIPAGIGFEFIGLIMKALFEIPIMYPLEMEFELYNRMARLALQLPNVATSVTDGNLLKTSN
jgi:hypothetical protein